MDSRPGIQQLQTPPSDADFTPLQEHQEQTPTTFFGAKPVLYTRQTGLTFSASKDKLQSLITPSHFKIEQEGSDKGDVLVRDVEVWVNSKDVVFFQTPSKFGISIPYPKIALHAVGKRKGVETLLMNLTFNDPEHVNEAEDIEILELVLLPPHFHTENPDTSCIREIYEALNRGAELHPDAYDDEEGEPDLTAPGATGWITVDNMDEFLDEDGNFRGTVIGGEDLGPGAGTVRQREGDEEEGTDGVNGVNGHEEKYQRTG